jgi:hypothetical protein
LGKNGTDHEMEKKLCFFFIIIIIYRWFDLKSY